PVTQALANYCHRNAGLPCPPEHLSDQSVETQFGSEGFWRRLRANVDTTSVVELEPASLFQVLVGGADGIRMNAEPPHQFPCARQACSRPDIFTEYRQNNLRYQLLANRHFTGMRDPEAHAQYPCIPAQKRSTPAALTPMVPRAATHQAAFQHPA